MENLNVLQNKLAALLDELLKTQYDISKEEQVKKLEQLYELLKTLETERARALRTRSACLDELRKLLGEANSKRLQYLLGTEATRLDQQLKDLLAGCDSEQRKRLEQQVRTGRL